jgi:hypothetical protein
MTDQEQRFESWRDEYESREGHAFPGRLEVWQAAEAPLLARIAELEAARIAYASEFPPDAEGLPDVGSIHANIRAMKADAERWRTEMRLRNDPGIAIMFVGVSNRCAIYRGGVLIASGDTYEAAIDAAIASTKEKTNV